MKRIAATTFFLALLSGTNSFSPHANAATSVTVAKASRTQHALEAHFSKNGLQIRACKAPGICEQTVVRYASPKGFGPMSARVVELTPSRRVLWISAKALRGRSQYNVLVAASDKKDAPEVLKLLKGTTGRPNKRADGRTTERDLLVEQTSDGHSTIMLLSRSPETTLCGRPLGLGVKRLAPSTWRWDKSPSRSLTTTEMSRAPRLFAKRMPSALDTTAPRALHARMASSAARDSMHHGLTDGDRARGWRAAPGRSAKGQFVTFVNPQRVPLDAFELSLHLPAKTEGKPNVGDAAPRALWLATDADVFHITLPEDAQQQAPGTSYRFQLPQKIKSGCLALVVDQIYAPKAERPQLAMAEFRAVTPFDGMSAPALIEALGTDQGAALRTYLLTSPEALLAPLTRAYSTLSEPAKSRALDVIEAGSCSGVADFFVAQALLNNHNEDTRKRLRRGLLRCKSKSTPALLEAFRLPENKALQPRIALVLAEIAPAEVFWPVTGAVDGADPTTRRGFRNSLRLSGERRRVRRQLDKWLMEPRFAKLPVKTRVEFLRAAEPWLNTIPSGPDALATVLADDDSFRTRYLLLPAARALAEAKDTRAIALLQKSLSRSEEPHLQARAALLSAGMAPLQELVEKALAATNPRVRAASLHSLRSAPRAIAPSTERAVIEALRRDAWTFVRVPAAQLLGTLTRNDSGDDALIDALSDKKSRVRVAALVALAERQSQSAFSRIHDIADDPREPIKVRRAAIDALATLCRRDAAPLLYKMARRAGPAIFPRDRELGLAAIAALGALQPEDLKERLAPLLAPETPSLVRQFAKRALAAESRCGGRDVASLKRTVASR